MTLKQAYYEGRVAASHKFALELPSQVDTFIGAVESGKDVLPEAPQGLDNEVASLLPTTTPMSPDVDDPTTQPPPMMGALGG
jgi:hypothetical protein